MNTKKLLFCVSQSVIGLTFGGIIYVLLGKNTYINRILNYNVDIELTPFLSFLRFYFADFLWAYGLCFSLSVILDCKKAAIITVLFSALYEILQYFNVISGTGVFFDVLVYLAASFIVAFIIKFLFNKEKKK